MGGPLETLPCHAFINILLAEDPVPVAKNKIISFHDSHSVEIPFIQALGVVARLNSGKLTQFSNILIDRELKGIAETIQGQVSLENSETHHLSQGEPVQIQQ